jgi:hypothetical protein
VVDDVDRDLVAVEPIALPGPEPANAAALQVALVDDPTGVPSTSASRQATIGGGTFARWIQTGGCGPASDSARRRAATTTIIRRGNEGRPGCVFSGSFVE